MMQVCCEGCGKRYSVQEAFGGKRMRCKQCQAVIAIPTTTQAMATVAATAVEPPTPAPPQVASPAPKIADSPPLPKVRPYEFRGRGSSLFALNILRLFLCGVLLLGALGVTAWAAPGLTTQSRMRGLPVSSETPMVLTFIGAAGLILLIPVLFAFWRYRVRHTYVFGSPLDLRLGCLAWVGQHFINALLLFVTLGLAWPWVYTRKLRFFYQGCMVQERPGQHLRFTGTGSEVFGYWVLIWLCFPLIVTLVILTLGVGGLWLRWLWIQWEQSHVVVPDPAGEERRLRLPGPVGGFIGQSLLGLFLTFLTIGLYLPWARVASWTWIADHTEVLEPRTGVVAVSSTGNHVEVSAEPRQALR